MSSLPKHLERIDALFKPLEAETKAMYDEGHFADDTVEKVVVDIDLAIQTAKQKIYQKINKGE